LATFSHPFFHNGKFFTVDRTILVRIDAGEHSLHLFGQFVFGNFAIVVLIGFFDAFNHIRWIELWTLTLLSLWTLTLLSLWLLTTTLGKTIFHRSKFFIIDRSVFISIKTFNHCVHTFWQFVFSDFTIVVLIKSFDSFNEVSRITLWSLCLLSLRTFGWLSRNSLRCCCEERSDCQSA
jgi:hypothetical protein